MNTSNETHVYTSEPFAQHLESLSHQDLHQYLVTRRELPYWWKRGYCTTILGIFGRVVKDIIMRGEIDMS